jgi:hypothetical protein
MILSQEPLILTVSKEIRNACSVSTLCTAGSSKDTVDASFGSCYMFLKEYLTRFESKPASTDPQPACKPQS